MLNPVEMAMPDADYVLDRCCTRFRATRALFAAAFPGEPDPITYDNFGKAIGAFERRLMTPSPLRRVPRRRARRAVADEQVAGLAKFIETRLHDLPHRADRGRLACFQKLGAGASLRDRATSAASR